MRNAAPKNIPHLSHRGTLAPRQNNLDKSAPIGYNDPISRARLEVNIMLTNIMLTIMKHLDRIHQYTEPSYHVKVCFS